jgi:hypothetical protein
MLNLGRIGATALGVVVLTGAASAMPLGQPGFDAKAGAGVHAAAWQCFQFGNCIWRPDAYFRPYPYRLSL